MNDAIERAIRIKQRIEARGLALGPCLALQAIEAFEAKHAITLPEEYRIFLQYAGDGGAGPAFHGVQALGTVPSDLHQSEIPTWLDLPYIAKPFPFTKPWIWESGEKSVEGDRQQVRDGSLRIGNEGCAIYWHLIVTGPDRDRMWCLCGEGIQPTNPPRTFLTWYEDWLDGNTDWWG